MDNLSLTKEERYFLEQFNQKQLHSFRELVIYAKISEKLTKS
ncbi:hypothetical protein [Streptococcus dentiloxodontae]